MSFTPITKSTKDKLAKDESKNSKMKKPQTPEVADKLGPEKAATLQPTEKKKTATRIKERKSTNENTQSEGKRKKDLEFDKNRLKNYISLESTTTKIKSKDNVEKAASPKLVLDNDLRKKIIEDAKSKNENLIKKYGLLLSEFIPNRSFLIDRLISFPIVSSKMVEKNADYYTEEELKVSRMFLFENVDKESCEVLAKKNMFSLPSVNDVMELTNNSTSALLAWKISRIET